MFIKFFKIRKYKKMVRIGASFITNEFALLVADTIKHFETEGLIKSEEKKEFLKFEATALLHWLFQKKRIFPETWHKPLLDEIHNQYYEILRRNGYDSKMRQRVCDDFNLRYKTYNEALGTDQDFSRVGAKFVRFLSERAKTDLDDRDLLIPIYLATILKPKLEEFKSVIEN